MVFERKIAPLTKDAYARLKREDTASSARWEEAIDTLLAGDHYLLVMGDSSAMSRVSAAAVARLADKIVIPLMIAALALRSLSRLLGPAVRPGSILLGLFFLVAVAISILQAVRSQASDWPVRRTILHLFGRSAADKTP